MWTFDIFAPRYEIGFAVKSLMPELQLWVRRRRDRFGLAFPRPLSSILVSSFICISGSPYRSRWRCAARQRSWICCLAGAATTTLSRGSSTSLSSWRAAQCDACCLRPAPRSTHRPHRVRRRISAAPVLRSTPRTRTGCSCLLPRSRAERGPRRTCSTRTTSSSDVCTPCPAFLALVYLCVCVASSACVSVLFV